MLEHIDEHSLKVLEYDNVLDILVSFAGSGLGKEAARAMLPGADVEWITRRMAETTEMRGLLDGGVRVPLAGLHDIRDLIGHMGKKQSVLEMAELLMVKDTLAAGGNLKRFFSGLEAEKASHLREMGAKLRDYDEIVAVIERCIVDGETIRDDATAKLKSIREQMGKLGAKIRRKFDEIISGPQMRNAVENRNYLTRNGRVVVSLKANYQQYLKGVVLDRSNTGATLYVEPYELAELSNELEELLSAEKREIWQILWDITRSISRRRQEILEDVETLGLIDLTYAKGRFSIAYEMTAPAIRPDSYLRLRNARHPLLLLWASRAKDCQISEVMNEIVPIEVRLGEDFDLLMLTGPNTGGKTVTLKTVGLLTLMAQSGMHIPAGSDSQIPVYKQLYADIGDEQSIQQSLSSFSSHIGQIVRFLAGANSKSLVLLDELGAGTDPLEGAVLATAILEKLLKKGSKVVATTHLGQLKSYAYTTARVENSSVQFDVETLKPTYQLLIGTPGGSNALEIAQRLGIPKEIIGKARSLLADEDLAGGELFNQMQRIRQESEENRIKTQATLERAKALLILASERAERIAQERSKLKEQSDREIDESMNKIRKLMNEFARDTQNAPKPWDERVKEFKQKIDLAAAGMPLAARQAKFIENVRKGDTVYVMALDREAIVQRISRKRQMMVLLMDAKQVQVPFTEIWEASG